jgi:hypothetical protein
MPSCNPSYGRIAGGLAGICLVGPTIAFSRPIVDEAKALGKTAADLPAASYDYFHDMDMVADGHGGPRALELTEDEIKGRNTWLMWCGGNEVFWDWLAGNSYGFMDLLKLAAFFAHPALCTVRPEFPHRLLAAMWAPPRRPARQSNGFAGVRVDWTTNLVISFCIHAIHRFTASRMPVTPRRGIGWTPDSLPPRNRDAVQNRFPAMFLPVKEGVIVRGNVVARTSIQQ